MGTCGGVLSITNSMVTRISKNRIHTDTSVVLQGPVNYAATSGTGTYTADPSPALTAYVTGAHYFISFGTANTSTTPTLNLNSLGAKTVVKEGTTALAAGDIPAGHKAILMYDGTYLVLMNPKAVSAPSGSITMHGGSSAPTGWVVVRRDSGKSHHLRCTFTIVGTTYGTGMVPRHLIYRIFAVTRRLARGKVRGLLIEHWRQPAVLRYTCSPPPKCPRTRTQQSDTWIEVVRVAARFLAYPGRFLADTTQSTGGGAAHNIMQPPFWS